LTTASSPTQLASDDVLFEGIHPMLCRGFKETALNTVISRLGGHLPLSDPRHSEIQLQKRIFLRKVRKQGGYPEVMLAALNQTANKVKSILHD